MAEKLIGEVHRKGEEMVMFGASLRCYEEERDATNFLRILLGLEGFIAREIWERMSFEI